MNKKLIVRQNGSRDCGPACLLSIMRYYGVFVSHEEVSYILKTTYDGTNAFNIINGSRTFGFDGYGIHYTCEEILNNKVNFPIICHVLKHNMYHFIVVYSVKNNYLEIMDPSSNITKINKDDFKKIYLNTSIVVFKSKEFTSSSNYKKINSFIFEYIKQNIKESIKVTLLSIIVIIFNLLTNYYIFININNKLSYNHLVYLTIVFFTIYITKNIIEYIRKKYLIIIENNIYSKLNKDILVKLFYLPYQFFKNKPPSEIISRLNDLKSFKEIFSKLILSITIDVIFIIVSSIILIRINYKVYFLTIIELFIYYLITLLFKSNYYKKTENILISYSSYTKSLNESINSYESISNLNLIKNIIKDLEIKFNSYIYNLKQHENILNIQSYIKNNICDLFYLFSIFICIKEVNNDFMTIGELILFNSILFYFTNPLKNIIDLSYNIIYLKNIYYRINDLFMIKNNYIDNKNKTITGDIKIANLSYSLNGIDNLFENVNIIIPYKSKFLLYGKSGNGKSTIIKILLKYLKEYKGDIYIDNVNIKDINENSILSNFTYVSQNSYLINDSLKNNITFYRNISDEEYENVINICNLNYLRSRKQLRDNFIIEDNGFNISGGEKQKIMLARSLLKKCNYLIFDESLSEIDFKEEIDIIKKIFDYFNEKTIIYISHKEEIINYFNMKYKLERR